MKSIKVGKMFELTVSLISGVLSILLGIVLIMFQDSFYFSVIDIIVFFFLVLGIKNFVTYFTKKGKDKDKSFIQSFSNLVFALFFSMFNKVPYSLFPIVVGLYFLVNAILQFIDLGIYFKNMGNILFSKTFYFLFYLIFGLILIIFPLKHINIFLKIVGSYLILIGIRLLSDAIFQKIPLRVKNRLKRRIRVTLPVVFECLIPYALLKEINEVLKIEDKKFIYDIKKNDVVPDLEVIVHTSARGFNKMGHVDLYFNGEIISYGNYDESSRKLHELFGDGVVFTTTRDEYISFCIEHSKKTLFVFGIKLTNVQKRRIEKEITKLKDNLVRWFSPVEEDSSKEYKDYASCLYKKTKAKFYKFKTGNFKTYFTLGNNCCLLADQIIGKSGIDLLKMNGLITPGTYYEYLNREFMKKDSSVVSRYIYNQKRKDEEHERKKIYRKNK